MSVCTAVRRSEKATLMAGGGIFKQKRGGIGFEPLYMYSAKAHSFSGQPAVFLARTS